MTPATGAVRTIARMWAQWRERLLPVMEQATKPYGYARADYPRVMLARMAPGGVIKPHRDANPAAKWPHKIHVPIQTNDKVTFFVDGVGYHFAEGEAVEVSNMARACGRECGRQRPHPPDLRVLRPGPAGAGLDRAA